MQALRAQGTAGKNTQKGPILRKLTFGCKKTENKCRRKIQASAMNYEKISIGKRKLLEMSRPSR